MNAITLAATVSLRQVKRYPISFRMWYFLYRRNTGVTIPWFSARTALFVDGYPRSGNTFLRFLIGELWPSMEFVHHFHAIAPLKIAFNRHIPSFVPFRDPAQSISSNYLKAFALRGYTSARQIRMDTRFLRELSKSYADYYLLISKNTDHLSLIHFESLINDPAGVMVSINRKISEPLQLPRHSIIRSVNKVKDRNFGSRDRLGGSKPSPEKEHAKKSLISAVGRLEEFGRCLELYDSLIEISVAQYANGSYRETSGSG
jgi:hypothetical protein